MTTSEPVKRVEIGCPGHLIVASFCHWRRHTRVSGYRISTVGDYYQRGIKGRQTVGLGRYFETMVFRITGEATDVESCGCGDADFSEIDFEGYNTAGAAQAGHEQMVEKYLAIANEEKT